MSLFSRLFRRRPLPSVLAPLEQPFAEAPTAERLVAPVPPSGSAAEAAAVDETNSPEEDAEAHEEADEMEAADEDADEPDPLSGTGEPLRISLPTSDGVLAAREEARRIALSGPQRVTPADPVGPGSLAETLALMETQDLVWAEVVDDPVEGFCILYRPTPRPSPP